MASIGVVSVDLIASSMGLNARQMDRLLASSHAKKWPEKLVTPTSIYQTSGSAKENGRPKKEASDLGDSGEISRDTENDVEDGE